MLPEFQDALVALPTVRALRALLPGGLEALPGDVRDALRRDEVREALDASERWLDETGPSDPDAALAHVLLLEGCDRLDDAVERVDELRDERISTERLDVIEAELRLERTEDERADTLLDRVLDSADGGALDGRAWGFVADLLLDLERDAEAIPCYERALERGADDFETAIRLAQLFQQRERWSRAAETFERAAELGGDVVGPWREAAECWRRAGELDRSLEARERVLSEGRGDAETWAKQGIGYREAGRDDRAIEALEKATRLAPRRPTYWIELAHLLRHNDQPERAADAYRRVLEFEDEFAEALIGLAAVALDQGDLERARSAAQDAVEAAPNDPEAHYVLGQTRRAAKQLDAARQALHRAVELDGDRADLRAALGELATETGDPDAAFEHLERAVELDPSRGEVIARFAGALLRTKSYERLRDLLGRPSDWNATPAWRLVRPLYMAVLAGLDEAHDRDVSPVDAFASAVERHDDALPLETELDVVERYALVLDDADRRRIETMIDVLEGRAALDRLS